MFEVGFTEIVLILGIALVVLGPEKLPKVAAEIGRWMGRARAMARQLKNQLDDEVHRAERDFNLGDAPKPGATPPPGPAAASDAPPGASAGTAPPGNPDPAARNEPPPADKPPAS